MQISKQEGFAGQVSVVLPESIKKMIQKNPLISDLFITDIGYYPKARHHFRERVAGLKEDILIYVVEGEGKVIIEDVRQRICANQFIVIPAGKKHAYMADTDKPWSIYWVHVGGTNRRIFDGMDGQVMTIVPSKTSRISERLKMFDELIEILTFGYSQDNLEYANLSLKHLLASFRYIDQFRKVNYSGEKDRVKKAILFMKQNVNRKMTLEEMADHFNISVSHFSRLFKQRTRHSPMDYFIQLKIQYACQLLDYSNLRVYEIANAIGYEDTYYFSRIFRKVMGVSPAIYKNKSGVT